ncbi:MAG: uridine kinase [Acholeplasmatales bacterium]|jgi:uridine kinase|nr:uridine kinase [Acholeplasmatales bacterium]
MKNTILILVAGGSASGKSTVVREIIKAANTNEVVIITQDDYYKDQSHLPFITRTQNNYDHPNSFDFELLLKHLTALLQGEKIDKPTYDFKIHNRTNIIEEIYPKRIIIVEGILTLANEEIRKLSSLNIFVELDDDTKFIRRMKRDLNERGRTLESIISQYENTVKPMFHKFIKPTKRFADVIIPNEEKHDKAVDLIASKIKLFLQGDN